VVPKPPKQIKSTWLGFLIPDFPSTAGGRFSGNVHTLFLKTQGGQHDVCHSWQKKAAEFILTAFSPLRTGFNEYE
jgi:hypothetical protein